MGADGYGLGGVVESYQVVESTTSPAGAEAENYTFASPMRRVTVQGVTGGPTMYVKWNADSGDPAAADDWDVVLEGRDVAVSPPGCLISQVSIYFSGAATIYTDFSIRGYK
jgi:hypothetical protein